MIGKLRRADPEWGVHPMDQKTETELAWEQVCKTATDRQTLTRIMHETEIRF